VYTFRWVLNYGSNRVLCPSYQGFRIYRETLSRFSCAASFQSCIFHCCLFRHDTLPLYINSQVLLKVYLTKY
ncbi:hypothetical protein ACT6QE_10620, partial [Staphylococcus aureus]